MEEKVKEIIATVLENNKQTGPPEITSQHHLRKDLGMDSMMLAELTVYVEEEFDVDIFEDGIVNTVGEISEKLKLQR